MSGLNAKKLTKKRKLSMLYVIVCGLFPTYARAVCVQQRQQQRFGIVIKGKRSMVAVIGHESKEKD